MPTSLQQSLTSVLSDLLDQLTLENVQRIAMKINAKGGLHISELSEISRCKTDQEAILKLYMLMNARGDASIMMFAAALRDIDKSHLAETLAPAVPNLATDEASAAGSSCNVAPVPTASKQAASLSDGLRKASAYIKEHLTGGETVAITTRLYSSKDIESSDYETIENTSGDIAKATVLLGVIGKKDDRVIRLFLSILRDELNRSDLANLVEPGGTSNR